MIHGRISSVTYTILTKTQLELAWIFKSVPINREDW